MYFTYIFPLRKKQQVAAIATLKEKNFPHKPKTPMAILYVSKHKLSKNFKGARTVIVYIE